MRFADRRDAGIALAKPPSSFITVEGAPHLPCGKAARLAGPGSMFAAKMAEQSIAFIVQKHYPWADAAPGAQAESLIERDRRRWRKKNLKPACEELAILLVQLGIRFQMIGETAQPRDNRTP